MLYTRGLSMVFLLTFLARSCRHIAWPTPGHGCNLLFSAAEHRTSADRESPPYSSTHLNRHGLATWISAGLVCLGWRSSAPRWHTYIIVTWSEFANTRDWIPLTCYVNLMLMWLLMFMLLILLTLEGYVTGRFAVYCTSGQFMPNLLEDRSQEFFPGHP